jgi:DNA-binding beta-propeller fold protein YncE
MEFPIVALGDRRYRVLRPWGALPPDAGKISDVTTDSDGNVYVLTRRDLALEPDGHCVHVLASDGAYRHAFGAGRLIDAHMIAADPKDRIWVVDRDAHELIAFSTAGRELTSLGRRHGPLEPFNHPSDVAFGPNGTIWVADGYAGGRVRGFSQDGTQLAQWGDVGTDPGRFLTLHAIWVLSDGRIVTADRENSRLQVFSSSGDLVAIWKDFYRPSDIWVDSAGHIFVSDGVPTVTMLDRNGKRLGRCRPVQNGAHGLWGDAAGRIYLAEGTPSRVTVLDPIT